MPLSTHRRTGQEGRSSLQSVWRKPLQKTKDLQPGKGQKSSKPRPSCQSRVRPEGPEDSRPDRQVGIQDAQVMSSEGAAQNSTSAKFDFHRLIRCK